MNVPSDKIPAHDLQSFDNAEAAVVRMRQIYDLATNTITSRFIEYGGAPDFKTQIRECYPYVLKRVDREAERLDTRSSFGFCHELADQMGDAEESLESGGVRRRGGDGGGFGAKCAGDVGKLSDNRRGGDGGAVAIGTVTGVPQPGHLACFPAASSPTRNSFWHCGQRNSIAMWFAPGRDSQSWFVAEFAIRTPTGCAIPAVKAAT